MNKAYGDLPGNRHELYKFSDINFSKIAQEMGCLGIRVERAEEIAPALKEAFEADKPALVEVITDETCKAL